MKRRGFAAAGAASVLAACAPGGFRGTDRPAIVLVHGAWHGAWCWERVTPLLTQAGYRVVAVTLPGMGERKAGLSVGVNLDSHIQAVAEAADAMRGPVALVGHSYGGFVITGAADRLAASGQLRSLVYLDAFVPGAGEKVSDYMAPEARAKLAASLAAGDPAYPTVPARFFGIEKPDDIAWTQERLTAQPAATYFQSLTLARALPANVRLAYIACQNPKLPVFDTTKARIRIDPRWAYRELQTGHDAMITAPMELHRTLLALV